jgi:alpha,alpha-trehalose phosphorylase
VGYLEPAYDYLIETVFTDLHDVHGNVSSGLHIAALAGAWVTVWSASAGCRQRHPFRSRKALRV